MKHTIIFYWLFSIAGSVQAQKAYEARVVLFFKDTINATMTVNLEGSNDDMITIVEKRATTEKKKHKRVTSEYTQTMKLNLAVITCFYIGGERYKFKDLKNGYDEKDIQHNRCVKRIAGTDTLGLFEASNGSQPAYYIQLPKDGFQIYNIDHPYVTSSFISFALLRFVKCETLADKIRNEVPGYFYSENGYTLDDKVSTWKNIISSYYNGCK